jgi:hypothetical protein
VQLGLEKSQHQQGGFLDAVKTLSLWIETPEGPIYHDFSLRIE